MDHYTSWWSFLPFYANLQEYLNHAAHPVMGRPDFLVFHVLTTALVVGLITVLALLARGHFSDMDAAVIPPRRFGVAAFFELLVDALLGMMTNIIGKDARRYFPLVGSLAVYIFCNNCIGLIPGIAPPTDNLNTTVACAIVVFLYYNFHALRVHGIGHITHMANPVGKWWGWFLAPLMFPIEVVGHLARILSLSLRLMGNMFGDHQVLFAFAGLVPVLVPLPFYIMGFLVCVIQTAVFCILTTVYIGTSVAGGHDEHEPHGEHEHAHAHAH